MKFTTNISPRINGSTDIEIKMHFVYLMLKENK